MSRYDGLIIPRSYSEYINKTDAATLLQSLQLSGVMDNAPTAGSNHPVKSSGVATAINQYNYPTIKETNANNCTAAINTIRAYELPTTASNIPSSSYVWNIIAIHNDRNSAHRLTQIAQGQTGQNTVLYIRVASSTTGEVWTWGNWEKVITKNDIVNTVMEYWNIFTVQEITETTATTKNTYASRKFSDYGQLMFILGASGTDYRQTIIIPRSRFSKNAAIVLRAYSGNNYVELYITYNDDTSFKVYKSGTAFAPYLAILGYGGLNI